MTQEQTDRVCDLLLLGPFRDLDDVSTVIAFVYASTTDAALRARADDLADANGLPHGGP